MLIDFEGNYCREKKQKRNAGEKVVQDEMHIDGEHQKQASLKCWCVSVCDGKAKRKNLDRRQVLLKHMACCLDWSVFHSSVCLSIHVCVHI